MKKTVNLGGEDRPCLFNKNSLVDLEKILGRGIGWIDFNSIETIRAIVYVGLKWGLYDQEKAIEPNPKFTLLKVGDWLEQSQFVETVKGIMDQFNESLPKPDPKNSEAGESPA